MSTIDDARKSKATDESLEPTAVPPIYEKYVGDIFTEEINHRGEGEARIFCWRSSVLGGIVGVTIALTAGLMLLAITALGAIWPQ